MKRKCDQCNGKGETECSITEFEIPKGHENEGELADLKADAIRCIADHTKICELNPRAKESYDRQLDETLKSINDEAAKLQ